MTSAQIRSHEIDVQIASGGKPATGFRSSQQDGAENLPPFPRNLQPLAEPFDAKETSSPTQWEV